MFPSHHHQQQQQQQQQQHDDATLRERALGTFKCCLPALSFGGRSIDL
jgi:hypothetical protein